MTRCAAAALALALAAVPAYADDAQPEAPGTSPAGAAPACGAEAAARVQERYDGIKALRARFVQTNRNVAFGDAGGPPDAEARGRVEFAKPGRMRFEYESPEPSLVVSDGATLWIYDPTAKEVQVLPVTGGFLSAAAVQFLLGEGRLAETFHVAAKSCAPDRAVLDLTPRAEAAYERIEIAVERKTGWIRETTVYDLLGNRTHLAFSDLEPNAPAPAERFRFDPPAGVRVLKLEPAEAPR
jgi:outer membrane lipoprotein carrier protein